MGTEGIYERYVNFYTDFAFKRLFGTEPNKELLISFLNALLHGREEIRGVRPPCGVRRILREREG